MGAWIEIIVDGIHHHKTHRSHPTWVRGLKYQQVFERRHAKRSHPTWVRGLK